MLALVVCMLVGFGGSSASRSSASSHPPRGLDTFPVFIFIVPHTSTRIRGVKTTLGLGTYQIQKEHFYHW